MKNSRSQLLFLSIFLLSTIAGAAQKVLIGGQPGTRLLEWSDFKGVPNESSPYYAYTAWKTNVKFGSVSFEGEKAIISGFEMTVEFDDKKSWVKKGKETDELLKHEQGHFDVGLLYMQEVLRSFAGVSFTRSAYKEEFRQFIEGIHKKYAAMGKLYDQETSHSIKKDEQAKWNNFFDENVKR
ncbi:MAG TPA: hypothetical protein VMR70_05070 [Flavisolibacter sp.]|nr:hypothetical protein [Flavisolibacter sp.]